MGAKEIQQVNLEDGREVIDLVMPDMRKLQLRLQGGVSAQVGNRSYHR